MKSPAKPARHVRRKPIAEKYQTLIASTVLLALIAGMVAAFAYVPKAPLPDKPLKHYSLQEIRR